MRNIRRAAAALAAVAFAAAVAAGAVTAGDGMYHHARPVADSDMHFHG